MRSVQRTARFVIGAATAGCLLAGCTPESGGVTGISVDAEGQPVAVIAMCEGAVDSLILYTDSAGEEVVAEWETSESIDALDQVNLRTPARPWKVVATMPALEEGETYVLYGATVDNDWSSAHVEFSTASLRKLSPDLVLTHVYNETTDSDEDHVSQSATFREDMCS